MEADVRHPFLSILQHLPPPRIPRECSSPTHELPLPSPLLESEQVPRPTLVAILQISSSGRVLTIHKSGLLVMLERPPLLDLQAYQTRQVVVEIQVLHFQRIESRTSKEITTNGDETIT